MSNNNEGLCKWCGRNKKAHESPPFEYAAMLTEQFRCLKGFTPWY